MTFQTGRLARTMSKDKILVVDDSPFMLRSMTVVLEKGGYDFCIASDGEEALRKVAEEKPWLIFLDAVMPNKDGYEVCRQIKADPALKGIRVIMATGRGEPEDLEKALAAGADGYMLKPYTPAKILEEVREALGESG
jgi:CheY-like chemotaxis protein